MYAALSVAKSFVTSMIRQELKWRLACWDTLATVEQRSFPFYLVVEDSYEIRNGSDTQFMV
jgi:hypothetical protein